MPAFLRRSPVCFYCGRRSSQKLQDQVRQWQCESCSAVNHLDEHGQITDPPAPDTPTGPGQYATKASRSISPELAPPSDDIFCPTCVKNQHLYTQALAEYLPDPSDASYAKYEASYPRYKAGLEERYPQVCARCAPRVNDRLRNVTYAAKTDHLRRLMEKTRRSGVLNTPQNWGWRDVLVRWGAVAWWLSVLGQMAWNALGALTIPEVEDEDLHHHVACIFHVLSTGKMSMSCFSSFALVAQKALLLGWLSFWWNNNLREKIHNSGRLVNLREHLQFQVVFLAIRTASWWALHDPSHPPLQLPIPRSAVHSFLLLFTIIAIIRSLTLVKFDKKPVVSFSKLEPVIAPQTNMPSNVFTPSSKNGNDPSQSPFPISALAHTPNSYVTQSPEACYQSMSISSVATSFFNRNSNENNYDDGDSAMDWTPTRSLTPRRPMEPQHPAEKPQSPPQRLPFFRATLPPAPEHPEHKRRKPKPAATFVRATEETRDNFWTSMTVGRSPGSKARRTVGDDDDGGDGHIEMTVGPGRLKLPQQDTGLESLFDSVFSIGDEPAEVRQQQRNTNQGYDPSGRGQGGDDNGDDDDDDPSMPTVQRGESSLAEQAAGSPWAGATFWAMAVIMPVGLAWTWMANM